VNTDVWAIVKELLWAIVILSPPFPLLAAHIFLPLKAAAVLIGMVVAVLSYGQIKKERKKGIRARPIAVGNIVLFVPVVIGYFVGFYQINSPGQILKLVEYLAFFYINVNIGFLLCIVLFLAPLKRFKGWFGGPEA
jgi:hypothetical protein